jgi:serum/glucocorticoid-regulated kinase 2
MSAPDHAGFLQKVGGKFIKQNQTRYFELRGTDLYYYKAKPSGPETEALGVIDLRNTKMIDNAKERFSWMITGPNLTKSYVLLAASDADKKAWMAKLSNPNLSYSSTQRVVKTKGGADSDDEGGAQGPSEMVFTTGKKVSTDDFTILSVIGKGAFGKVYLVEKNDSKEQFAMKEMDKEVIERENLVEHTFAEKSILQKIKHPFIVSLHYAFQTKEKLYLVLDFLAGGELFFHLGQSPTGRFDEWRAKFYTAQIGLAIGHLHSLDIIYRDLKPENCVLDKDGNVCLTDFGLAKTNVQGATAETFCGTPEYLAPEFLIGGGHGKAVDWWSLGILLYEMLQGIPPFYDENVTDMYDLILKKPLEFDETVSPHARDLLTKLLSRDPALRLQNVDTFKAHPFFHDIDWVKLYNKQIPPPFKPDAKAVNNFGAEFTGMKARLSQAKGAGKAHKQIDNFTYNGEASALPQ